MSLFDWFFNKEIDQSIHPDISFGRYSDSYKTQHNYEAWDNSLQFFEQGSYLDAYRALFTFLRDEREDNVHWTDEKGQLRFALYQGSKKITGIADRNHLRAEARVARCIQDRPLLWKRLSKQNYNLRYGRYALDPDNHICLVFDSNTLDASPYKIYYALKEMATQADKQDDLLLEEFNDLTGVNFDHLAELPESEKEIKYQYIISEIQHTLDQVENGALDVQKYPGGLAYLLLNLVYKLDYLINPEGSTMESLERMHRLYFAKDAAPSAVQKNELLIKELQKLRNRPREEYFGEMYRGKNTFGITLPVNHDRLVSLIDAELPNMDWYRDHKYTEIALAVPGYIVGYSLFLYALPKPDRDYLHFYFRIMESQYFMELGFSPSYIDEETGKLDRRAIRRTINEIAEEHRHHYPQLKPNLMTLDFSDKVDFARSYLRMIRDLDLVRLDI